MNVKSHQHWIEEIREYVGDYRDEDIIKLSLSYTLQSLRNKEDITRFQWRNKNGNC